MRDISRKTEGRTEAILAFLVLLVLVPCLLLVLFARLGVDVPDKPVYVNDETTTAQTFAQTLGIDGVLGKQLVEERTRRHGFESVEQMLNTPLFAPATVSKLADTLTAAHLDPATATPSQFSRALSVSLPVADRLAAYRASQLQTAPLANPSASGENTRSPAGETVSDPFPSAPRVLHLTPRALLRRATLLDPQSAHALHSRFLIRDVNHVLRGFLLVTLFLVVSVFLLPPFLRQKARLGGDPFLIPLMLLLSGLGVVMLFSGKDPLRDVAAYQHHAFGLFLALIALVIAARMAPNVRLNIRRYQYVWVFASVMLVVLLFLFGHGPEGVKLNLGGFFQPVEVIKIMLVFFLASYLADRAGLIADTSQAYTPPFLRSLRRQDGRPTIAISLPRRQDLGPVVVMFFLALTLFFVVKDLGPGLLLFATFVAVLYLTTGKGSFLALGIVMMFLGGMLGYWRHIGVFGTRVDMWLHPFANTHPNGMQLGQAYWALASGGWEGSGLGLGMTNLIPRGQDDLAFISWSEETGMLGAWLVLVVFAILVWRGVRIGLRAQNEFDRALAFGLTALIGLQALLILCGVTGVLPLTGISLPFLSYGNSALVADAIIIGLLRGISAPMGGKGERLMPPREIVRAAGTFALGMSVALLGVIGIWRLAQFQLIRSNEIALATVETPDADKVIRPHLNPRLLALAAAIPRGAIYDRNSRVVATSRREEVAQLEHDPHTVDRIVAARTRLYPFGPALAHLIGYTDAFAGGPFGMERNYNNDLRGYVRFADLLPDYRNHNLPGYVARKGHDLHLTIDAVLQRDVQQLLWQTATKLKDVKTGRVKDRAAFVLIQPQTGDVLVAASLPTFDPNALTPELYRKLVVGPEANAEHPLINRALDGLYAPGSTMKVATAACALENLPRAVDFRVVCNRVSGDIKWQAGGKNHLLRGVHDDKGDPNFGAISMQTAFVQSSNIYFATLAATLPSDTFRTLLAEQMGFHRAPKKPAFDDDLPYIGFGQGRMLATPLEMARLAGCVANDGKMMQSRLVTSMIDPAHSEKDPAYKKVTDPVVKSQPMRAETATILRLFMHEVTTQGTAAGLFDDVSVPVGGKTGTAQNREFDQQPHSWFIGFAPYGGHDRPVAPKYAFACVVENGGYGKKVAGKICHDVLKHLF